MFRQAFDRRALRRNGNFAALIFINHFEYTQDLDFARRVTYPLLEGLNAWWGCFLVKVPAPGGGYVYAGAIYCKHLPKNRKQTCRLN